MIVKDEEKVLPDCFESLHLLVDEVVVYDTGSTDSTVELARRAGARVIRGYWDDDFARARNACLAQCKGEWALWIDADERFVCPNVPQLRTALANTITDALAVEIYNLGDDPEDTNVNIHRALRLFRRNRCCWYGSIHEQVDLRSGLAGPLQATPLKGAHIDHIGYRPSVVQERDKLARNLRLAEAALARKEAPPGQEGVAEMNVGRALAALGRYVEAQPHFDSALSEVGRGITLRAVLLFSAQNLLQLGRLEQAVELARRLQEESQHKGLGYYLEAVALRRMSQPASAVDLFERVGELANEDGFAFPVSMLRAEHAGALLEAGRAGEAADQLTLLVEESPEVPAVRAALKVFAATGRSFADLVAVMPENRLDKVAAALLLVPPLLADPVAEALFQRFGPRPQLLAAAIRFAPTISPSRALEWSARLRSIGMTKPCPLVAQAKIDALDVPARVRAAVTAHAAFGDARGAGLATLLAPGLHEDQLAGVLAEVSVLDPPLTWDFARAAASAGAPEAGAVGTPEARRKTVAKALLGLGYTNFAAQIANDPAVSQTRIPIEPQLAATGADR
jgi:tetratricopeptide (TPR) repeat protein